MEGKSKNSKWEGEGLYDSHQDRPLNLTHKERNRRSNRQWTKAAASASRVFVKIRNSPLSLDRHSFVPEHSLASRVLTKYQPLMAALYSKLPTQPYRADLQMNCLKSHNQDAEMGTEDFS